MYFYDLHQYQVFFMFENSFSWNLFSPFFREDGYAEKWLIFQLTKKIKMRNKINIRIYYSVFIVHYIVIAIAVENQSSLLFIYTGKWLYQNNLFRPVTMYCTVCYSACTILISENDEWFCPVWRIDKVQKKQKP
jgi:hypothetical protein